MFSLIKIRLYQAKYEVKTLGIFHVILLLVILIVFEMMLYIGLIKYSSLILFATLLGVLALHVSREDRNFILLNFSNSEFLFFTDYILLTFPVALPLLISDPWHYFMLISGIAIISLLDWKPNQLTYNLSFLSKIIPVSAFEALSGSRKNFTFIALLGLYLTALSLSWVRGLPLFILWSITIIITTFFGESEPLNILRKDDFKGGREFIIKKCTTYIYPITLIYAPILIINSFFHADLWVIILLFLLLQLLTVCFSILYKYATYYPSVYLSQNNIIIILVGLCNLIPYLIPIVLLLNIRYYPKAVKNLNYYLL